jgi:hypothetical protein
VTPLSIEQAFASVQRTAAREWRLLLPVALAFFALPPLLFDLLVPAGEQQAVMQAMRGGDPRALNAFASRMLPLGLLIAVTSMIGSLALTALTLIPRISVAEALARAGRRLWVEVAAVLLLFAGFLLAAMVAALLFAFGGMASPAHYTLLSGLLLGLFLVVGVRMSVRHGVIVQRQVRPVSAIRESLVLTQGSFWRLLLGFMIYFVGGIVVLFALNMALGTVLLLGGRLMGAAELGITLTLVVSRLLTALFLGGLTLLNAAFYRQLDGASSGI